MAMKIDFNDPLISILDQWLLFMAMKIAFHEPWKNFHEKLTGLSEAVKRRNDNIHWPWKRIHETAVGSERSGNQIASFALL